MRNKISAPVPWRKSIEGWTDTLKAAGLSAQTIKSRRYKMAHLAALLMPSGPEDVTTEQIVQAFARQQWKPETRKAYRTAGASPEVRRSAAKSELDVRGMMVEEALMEVDRYISDCLMARLDVVTIIHGKGTGALRSAVNQYLRKSPYVKSFRLGVYGEGEDGVTIVVLK